MKKASRRKHGTGNIEDRPGGRKRVRARMDGELVTVTPPGGVATQAEAEQYAAAFTVHRSSALQRAGMTMRAHGILFLRWHAQQVRASTVRRDSSHWERICDELGDIPVTELRRADVVDFRDKMVAGKLGPQTIRNRLNLLRKSLRYALERELIEVNPAAEVRLSYRRDATSVEEIDGVLTPHEQQAIIDTLTSSEILPYTAEKRTDLLACYLYALTTGVRLSEQWWQRWDDVKESHVIIRYSEGGAPPKGGRPRRVPLLPPALLALDLMRGRSPDLVFPAPRGGRRAENVSPREWGRVLKAAGIKRRVKWHGLRHTCATSLLGGWWSSRKWTLEEVRKMLGHSSIRVTERYARLLDDSLRLAVDETEFPKSSLLTGDSAMQVLERIERRGRDSNSRITVLQTVPKTNENNTLDSEKFHQGNNYSEADFSAALSEHAADAEFRSRRQS